MAQAAFNQMYAPAPGVANQFNYGAVNTESTILPTSLNFQLPQAVGIPKRLKKVIIYPAGISSQKLGPNQTFRFVINAQEFLDPMSTFLKFTVEIPSNVLADDPAPDASGVIYDRTDFSKANNYIRKCVQLDNSAQSFISSFHAYCGVGGEDLERIDNYDVVACFLNDMCICNPGGFRTIDYSGNGGAYGSHFTNQAFTQVMPQPLYADTGLTIVPDPATADGADVAIEFNTRDKLNVNSPNPIINSLAQGIEDFYSYPSIFYDPTRNMNFTRNHRFVKDFSTNTTSDISDTYPDAYVERPITYPMPVYHMLHDNPTMGFDTIYGDGYKSGSISIGGSATTVAGGSKAVTNSIYDPLIEPKSFTATANDIRNVQSVYPQANAGDVVPPLNYYDQAVHGSSNPFPQNFGKTSFEPMFSSTINQKVIYNGIPSLQPITKMTFMIPLLSGIFGSLMQPNNYKLIPMVAFKNLTFEFTLNPYALFTSWSSTSFTDRSYSITSMELQCDMIEFLDLNVIDATNKALATGFVLCTQSYYYGPEFSYDNNNIPRSIQVNMGFDSMRSLFMLILDNAYKMNTMFRKQYRMSGNITSLQLKIGTEYFPQQPISGHGGNNFGEVNNYDFFISTMKCFNKLNSREELGINLHNFAINWRELYWAYKVGQEAARKPAPGDVASLTSNTTGYILKGGSSDATGVTTFQSYPAFVCNGMQLGIYYENRVIGKALYGICCTPANYENFMLEGKNTTTARPFDLLLNAATIGNSNNYGYPGSCSIMIFIYYDLVLSFSNGTVRALGRS